MHTDSSSNQMMMKHTRGIFFWTLGIVVLCLVGFALYRITITPSVSNKIGPVSIAAPAKIVTDPLQKVPYTVTPAPLCGQKCEWRDTKDNLYTLAAADGQTVVRVMINDHYAGYYMVVDAARPNNPITEVSTLEQAKYWSEKNADTILKRRLR